MYLNYKFYQLYINNIGHILTCRCVIFLFSVIYQKLFDLMVGIHYIFKPSIKPVDVGLLRLRGIKPLTQLSNLFGLDKL